MVALNGGNTKARKRHLNKLIDFIDIGASKLFAGRRRIAEID
jgi:hypothetical protein